MSIDQVRRSIAGLQVLVQLAKEQGVSLEVSLKGTQLTLATLEDSRTEVTAAQELQLVRNIVREIGHLPGLGLEAGSRYHLALSGIWGFAVACSLTFRKAAKLSASYHDLSGAFVQFSLHKKGERFSVVMDDAAIPADLRSFLLERDFAAFITMTREMRPGGIPLLGVEFKRKQPSYASRYQSLCGVSPVFGAATNAIWLDPKGLDIPLTQADPQLARMFEEQCRGLLDRRKMRGGMAGRVREALLKSPSSMNLNDTAARLFIGPRTLRRRLEEEGTSFRAVVEEVRQALAEEFLTRSRIKIEETAMRLGYADPSSFIAAFKRWNGMTPDAYRRKFLGECDTG